MEPLQAFSNLWPRTRSQSLAALPELVSTVPPTEGAVVCRLKMGATHEQGKSSTPSYPPQPAQHEHRGRGSPAGVEPTLFSHQKILGLAVAANPVGDDLQEYLCLHGQRARCHGSCSTGPSDPPSCEAPLTVAFIHFR